MEKIKKKLYLLLKEFDKKHPILIFPILVLMCLFKEVYDFLKDFALFKRFPIVGITTILFIFILCETTDTPGADPYFDGRYYISEVEYRGTDIRIVDDLKYSKPGEVIRFKVDCKRDYILEDILVYANEKRIDIEKNGDNYSFMMPEGNVSITAKSYYVDENGLTVYIKDACDTQFGYKSASFSVVTIVNTSEKDYFDLSFKLSDRTNLYITDKKKDTLSKGDLLKVVISAKEGLEIGHYEANLGISLKSNDLDSEYGNGTQTPGNGIQSDDFDNTIKTSRTLLDIPVDIDIVKKTIRYISFPEAEKTKYGQVLKNVDIIEKDYEDWELGVYKWKDSSIMPKAGHTGCEMIFVPADFVHYDYSYVGGWDKSSKTVRRTIYVDVSKSRLTVILPNKSIYVGDNIPDIYQEEISCSGFVNKADEELHKFEVINSVNPTYSTESANIAGEYAPICNDVILDNYEVNIFGGLLTVYEKGNINIDIDKPNPFANTDNNNDYLNGHEMGVEGQEVNIDLKDEPIIRISIPSKSGLTIDPYCISGDKQIYSDKIPIVNNSDCKVRVTVGKVNYKVRDDENIGKSCVLYMTRVVDGKKEKILVEEGKSVDFDSFVIGNEENKNHVDLQFEGDLADNALESWNDGDISIRMIFYFESIK